MTSIRLAAAGLIRGVDWGCVPTLVCALVGVGFGGRIFWRSILTKSPCFRRLVPLRVVQPSTPKAPIYRDSGTDLSTIEMFAAGAFLSALDGPSAFGPVGFSFNFF